MYHVDRPLNISSLKCKSTAVKFGRFYKAKYVQILSLEQGELGDKDILVQIDPSESESLIVSICGGPIYLFYQI